ncbi:hypothetical protein HQ945_05245 [Phyllobacterium sp. BT25]|uniref:Uncharacterized protein n=1 Tax=Phyllobacterium pellucidum TaxID=2740464 RepID=A0A849VRZ2_9HYPH|nr:hypothetical protein [Phyllobacterium pellucidum]NTS30653.1 hypothetical protein [Phyllobacterium pellucidum]
MIALIGHIPNWAKLAAGVALGAIVLGSAVYLAGKRDGTQQAAVQQLQSDIKAERERIASDAKVQSLSDYDFCIQSLRSRRMPVDACEQLRGVPESKP